MSPLLEVKGVTKNFAGITALDDASLEVFAGERVGLIGPNGAGKTTLFNCMLGVISLNGGFVKFGGTDLAGLPIHKRVKLGIGRTFQRIELFTDSTVRDHLLIAERVRQGKGSFWRDVIGLGRPTKDEIAACDAMLELLGLGDLADQPIEALSLGKGRLVEVGRALMTRPRLLMLDEPSSGLDREETAALAATLRAVQSEQGFAILLVEHDVELVSNFTERCYVLEFGRMIASGTTAEVMGNPRVREAYLGQPTEGGES